MQISVLICLEALTMQKSFLRTMVEFQFVFNQLYKQHILSKTGVLSVLHMKT